MMFRHVMLFAIGTTAAVAGCDSKESPATGTTAEEGSKATPTSADARTVEVKVDDKGFHPNNVEVAKGQKLTLEFERTHEGTCATKVVFPEIDVEKELPLNEKVAIEVPTTEARTLAFQCGMGMYKSAVLVK